MLMCNKKGVKNGFPLKIEASKVEVEPTDFNLSFIRNMLAKIDYKVFVEAAKEVDSNLTLPSQPPKSSAEASTKEEEENPELVQQYKQIHHALMEVSVIEGNLICPESGRNFPISNGIPNMLLNEDEV